MVYLNRKSKNIKVIVTDVKREENLYMCKVFRQERLLHRTHLCILAHGSSGSFLTFRSLPPRVAVSRSQAGGQGNEGKQESSISVLRDTH